MPFILLLRELGPFLLLARNAYFITASWNWFGGSLVNGKYLQNQKPLQSVRLISKSLLPLRVWCVNECQQQAPRLSFLLCNSRNAEETRNIHCGITYRIWSGTHGLQGKKTSFSTTYIALFWHRFINGMVRLFGSSEQVCPLNLARVFKSRPLQALKLGTKKGETLIINTL